MSKTTETHEAVVKLARGELEEHERINCWFRPEFVRALIDRLDAAHKREIEATAAKCCQLGRLAGYGASEIKHQQEPVGDAAKMREALESISSILKGFDFDNQNALTPDDLNCVHSAIGIADAALAAPRKNGEVGTAEEQATRSIAYCDEHSSLDDRCDKCPLYSSVARQCRLAFAQIPKEEGNNNGDK